MMGKRVDGGSKQCGGVREPGGSSAFVCNAMPKVMRETLYDRLKASFGNDDIFESRLPSSVEERDERFQTVHFSWWNRYGVSVKCLLFLLR